jgi:hypothetical protein
VTFVQTTILLPSFALLGHKSAVCIYALNGMVFHISDLFYHPRGATHHYWYCYCTYNTFPNSDNFGDNSSVTFFCGHFERNSVTRFPLPLRVHSVDRSRWVWGHTHRWASTSAFMSAISDIWHRHLLFRYRNKVCQTKSFHSDIRRIRISTSASIAISD